MARRLLVLIALCACRTDRPQQERTVVKPTPPTTATTMAANAPSPIGDRFRIYQKQLPPPASLSESNGASLQCKTGAYATYTQLDALGKQLPVANANDLLQLVPWAHDADPCVRQIAIAAIIDRIGLDTDRLSLPGMHERDHHHFHEIFVELQKYLRAKQVAIPAGTFDGMSLAPTVQDFAALHGTWEEEFSSAKNFRTTVVLDGNEVRVTTRRTQFDPAWPDHTWTTKIATVTVNERAQFVVTGEWNVESNAKGYKGSKITPSQFTYSFWPVRPDIVWFDEADGSWTKLLRITP